MEGSSTRKITYYVTNQRRYKFPVCYLRYLKGMTKKSPSIIITGLDFLRSLDILLRYIQAYLHLSNDPHKKESANDNARWNVNFFHCYN